MKWKGGVEQNTPHLSKSYSPRFSLEHLHIRIYFNASPSPPRHPYIHTIDYHMATDSPTANAAVAHKLLTTAALFKQDIDAAVAGKNINNKARFTSSKQIFTDKFVSECHWPDFCVGILYSMVVPRVSDNFAGLTRLWSS